MAPSHGFTFKQFHVNHDRCAMKVGTDGILLGAWAPVEGVKRILDIGTGSGLIALMLAQRSAADCLIEGIDIDADALLQAKENVAASPWSHRINTIHGAIQVHQAPPYDLIVSNPPYFIAGQGFRDPARAAARHTGSLNIEQLLEAADRLLTPKGKVALIIPRDVAEHIAVIAKDYHLHVAEYLVATTREGKDKSRILLLLSRDNSERISSEIVIYTEKGRYSEAYTNLTTPFYLKM